MTTDIEKINRAYDDEGSMRRLGMRPAADKAIQAALIPAGGDWQCVAPEGGPTRQIVWGKTEVALINPRGDIDDGVEADIAMGMRAMPMADKALRTIFVLARDPANCNLIEKIARAVIDYIEQPAPSFPDPEEIDDLGEDDQDQG